MEPTKGERRAVAQQKVRQGMRVSGKYFWIAIENSRAKRDRTRQEGAKGSTSDQQRSEKPTREQ